MKYMMFLATLFLGFFLIVSEAQATCYTADPCTCVTSGVWNQCRTCTKTDTETGKSYSMMVCGGNPIATKDKVACQRAQDVCNGKQPTCTPNPMTVTHATMTTGGDSDISETELNACSITLVGPQATPSIGEDR